MFKRFIFLFSVLVLFFSLVFGEFVGADREEKSVDIGKIYVEEKQSEIINGLNTNIMSSTVIKGKILEAGSKANVADAVKEAPGVYFQKAGSLFSKSRYNWLFCRFFCPFCFKNKRAW